MKKFLIIGNMNAITYKEIFPLIKNNQLWLGVSRNGCGQMYFRIDDDAPQAKGQIVIDGQRMQTIGSSAWFTNLDHYKRHQEIDLYKRYNEEEYPKYDNYDAIEVGRVSDIPMDYDGVIGVPITFLGQYCPTQFEIKGFWGTGKAGEEIGATYCDAISAGKLISWNGPTVNKQTKYFRILIKKKKMKKFLIIGNMNAIAYKEIFPLIKNNKVWMGVYFNKSKWFKVPDDYEKMDNASSKEENGEKYILVKSIAWFTNMEHNKRNEPLILTKKYDPALYPKYDNYDAIEVGRVSDIPMDYDGVIGVPITFLGQYCPTQFEIIDISPHFFSIIEKGLPKPKQLTLHNIGQKDPYARVLIKRVSKK